MVLGTEVIIGTVKWKVRAILLCGVFDAPARCCFMEMIQYNGFHGCPFCDSAGETVKTGEKGSTHVYPFNISSSTGHGKPRTHQETVTHAKNADRRALTGKAAPECGVKGTTWFMFLPKFDIIRGVAVDYMHCILLGVMKMLLHLWFDKQYRSEAFSISSRMKDVNLRLLSIKPPNFISRVPRSLEDLGHFKASEYKSFLLYYGLPCLLGILPDEYYQHFLLLVQAVFSLLKESITERDLKQASALLKHFCLNMSVFYGKRYETSNVHLLLHLVEKVRDLGPLWSQSCFYFEDYNGELRKLFHGTQSIERQITLAVSINQKLPQMDTCLTYGTGAYDFYSKLAHKGRGESTQRQTLLLDNIRCVGAMTSFTMHGEDKTAVEKQVGQLRDVQKFKRISIGEQVLHSVDYKSVLKRNSSTVLTKDGNIYQIKYYVKVYPRCPNAIFCMESSQCVCRIPHYFAVSHLLEKAQIKLSSDTITHATVGHIVPVNRNKVTVAVPLTTISSACVFISYGGSNVDFVCQVPNQIERE